MGMIEPLVTARRVRAKALLKKPGFEGLGEFIDEYVPEWIHCKGDMTSMPRELVAGGLRRGEVLMAIPEVLQEMEYQDRESIIFKGYFQPMMSHPELRAEVLADPNYDIWRQ